MSGFSSEARSGFCVYSLVQTVAPKIGKPKRRAVSKGRLCVGHSYVVTKSKAAKQDLCRTVKQHKSCFVLDRLSGNICSYVVSVSNMP